MKRAPKVIADIGAIDIYKFYCESTGNPLKLSQKEYTNILKIFYSRIFDKLIYKGIEFTMPYRLGNLRVKKQKVKIRLKADGSLDKSSLRPNWKECRDLWTRIYADKTWEEVKNTKGKPMVYHENKHTNRFAHGWHWDKTTCTVKNNTAYSLDIARDVDRKLAGVLKSGNTEVDYSLY